MILIYKVVTRMIVVLEKTIQILCKDIIIETELM